MTGLMAALENGHLELADWLLRHKDIDTDFTKTDSQGRTALDMVIQSDDDSDYIMNILLEWLDETLTSEELHKELLPKLLSCVKFDKVNIFRTMLKYFHVNFKESALLSFLIVSGEAKFIEILAEMHPKLAITEQNKSSLLYALRSGKTNVVEPLLSHYPHTFINHLQIMLQDGTLGNTTKVEQVKEQIFSMLMALVVQNYPTPIHLNTFEIGINCIDINLTDRNGITLLMKTIICDCPPYATLLMKEKSLEVNKTTAYGYSALDILNSLCDYSDELMISFLERQTLFNDVDFSKSKKPFFVKALNTNRLELAANILNCNTYHASYTELDTARDILKQSKRVLLHKNRDNSHEKKILILELLYNINEKIRNK